MTATRPAADVVGIDIGGSKTHAVRTDSAGRVLAEVTAGSANFESVSRERALAELDVVFAAIGTDPIDVICVGSAGINTPEQERDLAAVLAARSAGAPVIVAHDTRLILAAAELDAGIAVICGTGSVAWGRTEDGRSARAGGWGYLLGDEGSGYWLAREAVRHVLRRHDDGAGPDALSTALCSAAEVAGPYELLGRFYAQPARRYWAGLSPVIFDLAADGDETAASLIDLTAAAVAEQVTAVAGRLGIDGPVALGGGLVVHQPLLQDRVRDRLTASGVVDIRVLNRDPVFGAVRLALAARRDNDRMHRTEPSP